MDRDRERDDALDTIAYGDECAEVLSSRPWQAVVIRKALLAKSLLRGQYDAQQLALLRAKYDELVAIQHALKSGIEDGKNALAELAEQD